MVDGWRGVKAIQKIAYSNKKPCSYLFIFYLFYFYSKNCFFSKSLGPRQSPQKKALETNGSQWQQQQQQQQQQQLQQQQQQQNSSPNHRILNLRSNGYLIWLTLLKEILGLCVRRKLTAKDHSKPVPTVKLKFRFFAHYVCLHVF